MNSVSKKKITKPLIKRRGRGIAKNDGKPKPKKAPLVISLSNISSDIKIECSSCSYKHPKTWDCPTKYSNIEEIPTFTPSDEEFSDPIQLFSQLYKLGYHKYGAVKIKAPSSWNPQFSFGLADRLITTRIQELKELTAARVLFQ